MKISTKGRYALRLMMDLAETSEENPVSLRDVAARQGISEKYLEQIISILNKAGFVKSIRGAQGGYQLVKNPWEYTVGMILRLTEKSVAPVACVEDEAVECERRDRCATAILYMKLNEAIKGVIDHVTLQDLLDWQKSMNKDGN